MFQAIIPGRPGWEFRVARPSGSMHVELQTRGVVPGIGTTCGCLSPADADDLASVLRIAAGLHRPPVVEATPAATFELSEATGAWEPKAGPVHAAERRTVSVSAGKMTPASFPPLRMAITGPGVYARVELSPIAARQLARVLLAGADKVEELARAGDAS